MAQLMPLPLIFSCSSKIQIGFSFLVPAYPGCPGKEAVKWLLLLLFTRYEAMNGGAKCRKWGGLGWLGSTQGHGQCHHSIERIRLPT